MKIKPTRVYDSLIALADWRRAVNAQGAQHLWPLLALLKQGVSEKAFKAFKEEHDFQYWNRYHRMPGDERPAKSGTEFQPEYYINPLTRSMVAADHPHRSPATFRDRTFAKSWQAAERDGDTWKLSEDYSQIFKSRVLTKSNETTRCPVVDLAVWLFKDEDFPPDANAEFLVKRFREVFKQKDADFETIFQFTDEDRNNIFTDQDIQSKDYATAIEKAMLPTIENVKRPPNKGVSALVDAQSELMADDDPILIEVVKLLDLSSAGVIFRGCPGTGKTWYARRIARRITDSEDDIFFVQFHPSFGYEDFVEGYSPEEKAKSGFKIVDKIFLRAVTAASSKQTRVVLIIDEINRGDPARVLGEVLTYIESSYRNEKFILPYSGRTVNVPANLVIFGTMNPYDRSISQLDWAFLRRFDHIDMAPSGDVVAALLDESGGFTSNQVQVIKDWFEDLQSLVPFGVGHAYFGTVRSVDTLRTVWSYRIWPYCELILELDESNKRIVIERARAMFRSLSTDSVR